MNQFTNQVLRDRYQLHSLLGRKTGRRTFLAIDLDTRSPVVIKLLLFGPDFTWDDLKLFEREAETLKSLDHLAIPKYLDFFEIETELGKGFALVQTYIEARSLQGWIESGRTFNEAELKAIATQLLDILDYLHTRQPPVIHRDIKPSNLLLTNRSGNSPGQVYLVDFGSVQTAQQVGTITVVGTYGYMPPEQFGGKTTPASDLYALGASLIYLATGQHPSELPQKEMRVLFADQVSLNPVFVDWLQWMTEPSLELRLKSAQQALEALAVAHPRTNTSAIARKPIGSKVRVTKTQQKLEILVPRRWTRCGQILMIGVAVLWNYPLADWSFFWKWFEIALITWNEGGCFIALYAIAHLGIGLWMIWLALESLSGETRLCITLNEISLTHKCLGLKYSCTTILRHHVTEVVLCRIPYTKGSGDNTIVVSPHVVIWAGTKKIQLGQGRLTDPELCWLAQELSDWLNLPIIRIL